MKEFKPFQQVLVKRWHNCRSLWVASLYSHYDASIDRHYVLGFKWVKDNEILPYRGNEDKLGK